MDGYTAKKSTSFETLVIQNITNVNELKAKLSGIILAGEDYQYDVSDSMKVLLTSTDQDIVQLCIEAIAELVKCEQKRDSYANKNIIGPILDLLRKEHVSDNIEPVKQCCRALGNLCCDCDTSRRLIVSLDGIPLLVKLLERSIDLRLDEIQTLASKTLLNFAIGGAEFTEIIFQAGVVDLVQRMLSIELKRDDFDDDTLSTCLLILSVINDNTPELLYSEVVNKTILQVLRDSLNMEISELCLDHLHAQAEHESVKTLIAKEGGVQLVCNRLEELVARHTAGELNAADTEVEALMKQACELVIIVLTGDEAMHILYNKGVSEVYQTVVKWLDSPNHQLLTTAVLAIGNFARQDDYCTHMMEDKIFDKLLDIFEVYNNFSIQIQKEPEKKHPIDPITVIKLLHAVLSSLRNLAVPVANKRVAAAQGRAAPMLLNALPTTEDHHVAYKLLATIRLLVDGQEGVAKQLANNPVALATVAKWGHAAEYAGAAGEAPRLLAWAIKQLRHHSHWRHIVEVDGCISSLVNMLVASHSLMQNEAILALTLLAIESLKKLSPDSQTEFDYEKSFVEQLIKSEIGKHVTILIDTNCAKMPVEVAENLLAFLDITSKINKLALDYKDAKVHECLMKFSDSRADLTPDMKSCIFGVFSSITNNGNKTD
ncbi:hypothetical protein SFRURICE_013601 [Spodoptera frugiperda]|uniref:GTPase-GDP dissociation stimulator vimar n=1 Tax=Spodoptera frugiperda TaxID=7108 RepID=A0A2H1VCX0_SPOFR|nr:GTPase-GDP dissociation stimulator vimar [Spodoptera frugiperda]KAF9796137.1 hypothetical protein SFRURICE_013601 [Spodoptera frugiperda]